MSGISAALPRLIHKILPMQPVPKFKQPEQNKKNSAQKSIEEGRRLSRISFIPYGISIVIALFIGGALVDSNPWGDGVTKFLVPISSLFVLVGLGLNVVAIRRGAITAGIWRLVVGLTLIPVLIWGALTMSIFIYYAL